MHVLLFSSTAGAGVHAWIPTAAAMEALGCLLHSLCVPGTVLLLSGHLGSGKTAIARGIVRAFCGDPAMFVPSPTFLLNLTYQEDLAHDKVWCWNCLILGSGAS
jgi:tRNA A37 threonylcarbamoyladenosine biosynthesis protein TsaE